MAYRPGLQVSAVMPSPCGDIQTVAALFARADSIYKALPGVDVWDVERDARKWPGGCPVVAHPPCRAWGQLRHFAKPRPDEKELAVWSVDMVRKWGGVLEHPARSTLWPFVGLPSPGSVDAWGGWTLPITQNWWGHRAEKATFLYIVGVNKREAGGMPLVLGRSSHVVCSSSGLKKGDVGWRPHMSTAEREKTPPELAAWLVNLARFASEGRTP